MKKIYLFRQNEKKISDIEKMENFVLKFLDYNSWTF